LTILIIVNMDSNNKSNL